MQSALTVPDDSHPARPGRFTSILVLITWTAAVLAQVGMFLFLLPVKRYRDPAGIDASLQVGDLATSASVLLMATFGAFIVLRSADRRVG